MEPSPLIKAHDHARAAAVATTRHSADTTVAINEHTLAAGEFATAARSTSSIEALRTLKLLEEHHRRLAELLNIPDQPAQHAAGDDADAGNEKAHQQNTGNAVHSLSQKEASTETQGSKSPSKPGLPQPRRIASREMSSSIASNLASARGIRSKYRAQPLTPSVSNDEAPGNLDPHPRRDGSKSTMQTLIEHQPGKPTWIPPTAQSQSKNDNKARQKRKDVASSPTDASSAQSDDAGYNRFYNTFGSLINRISAPLAFASLPLIQEESTLSEESQSSPESSRSKPSIRARPTPATSVEPDLTKVISKATMNAILKDGVAPSDSFYVVPTSGHTISYANILSYAEKEKRRLEASSHGSLGGGDEEDDDFVDAKETPTSLSPGAKRRVGRARTDKELSNTIEELYTENKSLKDMLDKLTKRLHAFEASAQNMAESYRMMRPGSPLSNASSSRAKVADDEYSMMKRHIEKLEKENKKMQKTLDKYREKWETLKAGAKARREAQGGGDAVDDTVPG
ncbi:hypothetical protein V2G26_006820 [Clonostachys chloroleuca]